MAIYSNMSGVGSDIRKNESAFNQGSNYLSNLIGEGQSKLSAPWGNGFIGINAGNRTQVGAAIMHLVNEVEGVLNGFKSETIMDQALKGQAEQAANEYINAVKSLLLSYVTSYRNFYKLLNDSFAAIQKGDTQMSQTINEEASRIRTEASKIQVDIQA